MLAIQHIIASSTLEDACRKAKISKGTIYAWLKESAFKTELKRQRDEVVNEALDCLKCALTKAVDGLIGLLDSPRDDLRRWICKDIIEYSLKSIELEDIETRLDKIEAMILEGKK